MPSRLATLPPLLIVAFALSACEERKPMLTIEVLAKAAQRCSAGELRFIKPGHPSAPPSFSYVDPGSLEAGRPTPVSNCLAKALKNYRFESMEIRFEPGAPADR